MSRTTRRPRWTAWPAAALPALLLAAVGVAAGSPAGPADAGVHAPLVDIVVTSGHRAASAGPERAGAGPARPGQLSR